MLYLLDSNICIHYIRNRAIAQVIKAKFLQHTTDTIQIPAIVVAELLHGAYHSKRVEENLMQTLDFLADFVTNNTREFSRIDGLKLNDWTI